MKHHKSGTLGEQCAGEEKKVVVEKAVEPTEDVANPWGYNLLPPVPIKKEETQVKSEEEKPEVPSNDGVEGTEVVKDPGKEGGKKDVDFDLVKVKSEPLDVDGDITIKQEPIDGDIPPIKREPYADGIYKAAPIVLDSDSDEFEPESDESAPSDDDVEAHLGMTRRKNFKEKAKKRKRKVPANATVIYIKNAAGQKIKKVSAQKESSRWVPPHPWVPYKNQVTVEQVCQFLEMVDYPIAMNESLKEKFKDKDVFDEYARPLFTKVNPNAHPLTLMTLIKAKWFEVMNTFEEKVEDKVEQEHISDPDDPDAPLTESRGEPKVEPKVESVFPVAEVKRPVIKKIKLNWAI